MPQWGFLVLDSDKEEDRNDCICLKAVRYAVVAASIRRAE
jgi:hypothetical protein